jgi:hypothetical protein
MGRIPPKLGAIFFLAGIFIPWLENFEDLWMVENEQDPHS